jgi:hypothetical protein
MDALKRALSRMPMTSRIVMRSTTSPAGRLQIEPVTNQAPVSGSKSNGFWIQAFGSETPKMPRNDTK